ncbi:Fatty acid synthase subunit alpha [Fusarium oxysporum f. sp. albedinis]|nr:Fatty acid synthase subunit alpha [Fusarium oxysporum f. sp. albedinis]
MLGSTLHSVQHHIAFPRPLPENNDIGIGGIMSPVLGATRGKVWSMDGVLEMEYYRLQHHSIIVILDRSSLIIETRLKAHYREYRK